MYCMKTSRKKQAKSNVFEKERVLPALFSCSFSMFTILNRSYFKCNYSQLEKSIKQEERKGT